MLYNKLWKLFIDKNLNKIDIRDGAGFTSATISKLSHNKPVSMNILAKICEYLEHNVEDI